MSNFTPPGFAGGDNEDGEPMTLTVAQADVIVSGWPESEWEGRETLPAMAA